MSYKKEDDRIFDKNKDKKLENIVAWIIAIILIIFSMLFVGYLVLNI